MASPCLTELDRFKVGGKNSFFGLISPHIETLSLGWIPGFFEFSTPVNETQTACTKKLWRFKVPGFNLYAMVNCKNPYRRKIQNMVEKFKIFLAEEVLKVFSDSDY